MFITVTQGYKAPINYSLQMLWLVTAAFSLASALAFMLSHYVLDAAYDTPPAAVVLPSIPTETRLMLPPRNEPERPSALPVPVTLPMPLEPSPITVQSPAKPKAVLPPQHASAKAKPVAIKAVKPPPPHLGVKPKPKLKAKPLKLGLKRPLKLASQAAKQPKSPTLKPKPKAQAPITRDFKTLEQSLGIDL